MADHGVMSLSTHEADLFEGSRGRLEAIAGCFGRPVMPRTLCRTEVDAVVAGRIVPSH
jgi:hypothetical protein